MGNLSDIYGGGVIPADEIPEMDNYDPIPPGWYPAMVEGSEIKETQAGTGCYLSLQFGVIDGPFKGRKIFTNINLKNPSVKCEDIGMQQLGALSRAAGVMKLADSAELHDKPLQIKVKIKTSEQYGAQNEVNGYKAIGQGETQAPAGQPAAPQASFAPNAAGPAGPVESAPAASVPPWKRK